MKRKVVSVVFGAMALAGMILMFGTIGSMDVLDEMGEIYKLGPMAVRALCGVAMATPWTIMKITEGDAND